VVVLIVIPTQSKLLLKYFLYDLFFKDLLGGRPITGILLEHPINQCVQFCAVQFIWKWIDALFCNVVFDGFLPVICASEGLSVSTSEVQDGPERPYV